MPTYNQSSTSKSLIDPRQLAYATEYETKVSSYGTYKLKIEFEIGYTHPNIFIPEFTGQLTNSANSDQHDPNHMVLVKHNSAKPAEVWYRSIPLREYGKSPMDGVKMMRKYNIPCFELSISDFIQGRNNTINSIINNLGLSFYFF